MVRGRRVVGARLAPFVRMKRACLLWILTLANHVIGSGCADSKPSCARPGHAAPSMEALRPTPPTSHLELVQLVLASAPCMAVQAEPMMLADRATPLL